MTTKWTTPNTFKSNLEFHVSIVTPLLKILLLHGNFLANLLKKLARKDFFLLSFLNILIGR